MMRVHKFQTNLVEQVETIMDEVWARAKQCGLENDGVETDEDLEFGEEKRNEVISLVGKEISAALDIIEKNRGPQQDNISVYFGNQSWANVAIFMLGWFAMPFLAIVSKLTNKRYGI